ncbi:MAG: hypothetical protein KF858_11980 [Candidatus Sumerlaeia bacterium]|nr:hypothetical protein [Candidatus Sumerlaeia bacterium]
MKRVAVLLSFAAVSLSPATGWSQERVLGPSAFTVLSDSTESCRDPVVDAAGTEALVAWTSTIEGRSRVVAVRRVLNDWTFPYPVDDSLAGDCTDPVVRFTDSGRAGIAWIRSEGDEYALEYAPPGGFPREVARASVRMESPALAFDAAGRAVLAWTEGSGGRFVVVVARETEEGRWERETLSGSADAYDIFPATFNAPEHVVYWYGLGEMDFELRGARRGPDGWETFRPTSADFVPANRFPLLYDSRTAAGPGAVWVEPLRGGEIALAWDARFPETQPVLALPGAEGVRQVEPDASSTTAAPAFVWREETAAGSQILVLTGEQTIRVTGFAHPSQPRLAADRDGGLHLVLVSDRAEGGTGRIYWTRLTETAPAGLSSSPN